MNVWILLMADTIGILLDFTIFVLLMELRGDEE